MADKRGTLERCAEGLALALLPLEELLSAEHLPFLLVEIGLDEAPNLGRDPGLQAKLLEAIAPILQLPAEIEALIVAVEAEDVGKIILSAGKLIEIIARFAAASAPSQSSSRKAARIGAAVALVEPTGRSPRCPHAVAQIAVAAKKARATA